MKLIIFAILLLGIVSFVACAIPPNIQARSTAGDTATISPVTQAIDTTMPAQTTNDNGNEEAEVRDLVEIFGGRLKNVSLLAPDAAQEIQKEYSEFVSPNLLEMWLNDVSKAPGRKVSSPWPDHIEISNLSKVETDRYEIAGFVIEITSEEVVNGGEAARIPVHITVQKDRDRWLIAEYSEEQP